MDVLPFCNLTNMPNNAECFWCFFNGNTSLDVYEYDESAFGTKLMVDSDLLKAIKTEHGGDF